MDLGCSICQETFLFSSNCTTTKCGHVFHHTCLAAWTSHSRTCPTCRAPTKSQELTRIYFTTVESDQAALTNNLLQDLTSAGVREVKLTAENTNLQAQLVAANKKLKNLEGAEKREIKLSAEIRDLKAQLAVTNNKLNQPPNGTPVQISASQPAMSAPEINSVAQPPNISTGKNRKPTGTQPVIPGVASTSTHSATPSRGVKGRAASRQTTALQPPVTAAVVSQSTGQHHQTGQNRVEAKRVPLPQPTRSQGASTSTHSATPSRGVKRRSPSGQKPVLQSPRLLVVSNRTFNWSFHYYDSDSSVRIHH